jgi:hypothetical protein
MKTFNVVLLMCAAALGGGLVVRYTDHPVEIIFPRSVPPPVVAPPIHPTARVGPSTSVPVRSAAAMEVPGDKPVAIQKPSAFSLRQPVTNVQRKPADSPYTVRVQIPPEPPAVTFVGSSSVPDPAPAVTDPKPDPAPVQPPSQATAMPPPPAPESNHATLRAGMLITVRINEALSSNLNSKGDVFSGILDRPLIADGFVIAERGARVRGEVVESKAAGGSSELSIRLREILASDGQRVHIVSEPWRKAGNDAPAPRASNVYDIALTRGGAAVIRPLTSITFRLDQAVELTERR